MGQERRRGSAMVVFEGTADAVAFLNVTTRFEPGGKSLYNRMSHQGCRGVRCWDYELCPVDYSYNWSDDSYTLDGQADFDFHVHVYFPATDIPMILTRLIEFRQDREILRSSKPRSSKLKTARWNQTSGSNDGLRVLVTRYRPRGVRQTDETWDEWWKDLGPSKELHADYVGKNREPILWGEFRFRYLKEMKATEPREKINQLAQYYNAGMTITLLCYCEDEKKCHRSLLKQLVLRRAAYLRRKAPLSA